MNKKHLEVLKGGVTKWNNWRKQNSKVLPDLSGANLSRVNFEGANLAGTILCDADLSYANLSRANLSGAKLQRANLGETIFKATVLDGAKFHHTYMRATMLINVNLGKASGLDKVHHLGPSAIDFGTINTTYRSKGKIPEAFLSAAGIPATFIEYIHSRGKNPFDYHSCFISYTSENLSFVKSLHNHLEAKGVRCWFAPEDLKIGGRFPQLIEDAIRDYDKFIIVLSKGSIRSGWVEREVNIAREMESEKRKVFIPVYLDHSYLSPRTDWVNYLRSHRHIGNFQDWKIPYRYEPEFKKLLEILEKDEV